MSDDTTINRIAIVSAIAGTKATLRVDVAVTRRKSLPRRHARGALVGHRLR